METKEIKDKKIKLFRLLSTKNNGYEEVVKQYIHSEVSGGLWAFVRELSETERFSAKAVQVDETILFKVVFNPKITSDLYIEFGENTYNIVSIDKYQFNKTDIVIKANQIPAPVYDEVQYEQY